MAATLKPVDQQVIVITGASSGIGLATAEAAANKGATVVLAARSRRALDELAGRINASGGRAIAVECDVAERGDLERVAQTALDHFGRIDTWVNNAGTSIYGRLEEVSEDDSRRLFDINFWGVVNGSLAALPHLRAKGGALINLGSEVSEAVVPLLGMYTATKHAVKGFTDALRIEVEQLDKAPVSITLIEPTAVDTPFPHHARNYLSTEPSLPTPQINPEQVAEAILEAAAKPTREKKVGSRAVLNTMVTKFAPAMGERMAAKQSKDLASDDPPRNPEGILRQPSQATTMVGRAHGDGQGDKRRHGRE